jgi:hypothetical protein
VLRRGKTDRAAGEGSGVSRLSERGGPRGLRSRCWPGSAQGFACRRETGRGGWTDAPAAAGRPGDQPHKPVLDAPAGRSSRKKGAVRRADSQGHPHKFNNLSTDGQFPDGTSAGRLTSGHPTRDPVARLFNLYQSAGESSEYYISRTVRRHVLGLQCPGR